MPFSNMTTSIAISFKQLPHSRYILPQILHIGNGNQFTFRSVSPVRRAYSKDSMPGRIHSAHKTGSAWSRVSRRRVCVRKHHSFFRQFIDIRSFIKITSCIPRIVQPQVIGHNKHDIHSFVLSI